MKENHSPLVSVLMCTYNNADYLGEAIESILTQTYQNIELIIVNDGSTDQTRDIIFSYKTPKIQYVENEKNIGQEGSKNKGISAAKGKYIAYMDGDDISDENRIATQVELLETHPDIGICSTGITYFGQKRETVFTGETDERIRLNALFSTPMAHATCMIRREIIETHDIRYEKGFLATEDYWFMLLILAKTKAYSLQQSLYRYRWHGENISVKKGELQFQNFRKISHQAFKQLLKIDFPVEDHAKIFAIFRGDISVKELHEVHPILLEALNTADSPLIQPFKQFYAEHLIRIYTYEAKSMLDSLETVKY